MTEQAGVVEEWDEPRGVGRVRADDGRALDLQCTHIADGSRTTSVGTRVTFVVAPGHHGRWQALAVAPDLPVVAIRSPASAGDLIAGTD